MQLSGNAIAWLNGLFQDRIAGALRLSKAEGESDDVDLHLPGAPGKIVFRRRAVRTTDGPLPVAFKTWDIAPTGLVPPLDLPLIGPVFDHQAPPCAIETDAAGYVVLYDLLFLIYWQLTRLEEYDSASADQYGRFPASASFALKNQFLERPIVDEWFALLAQMAKRVWPQVALNLHVYRLEPTHDVDFPSRYAYIGIPLFMRMVGRDLILKKDLPAALQGMRIRLASHFSRQFPKNDPFDTFDWILQESEKRDLQSTFYFMCQGADRLDPGYDPHHPALRALINKIGHRGHHIGLHPSFRCIDQQDLLEREVKTMRQILLDENIAAAPFGARMHYYHCRYPHTFRQLEQAGITYDATMGYADHVGFRAGTSIPYRAFDAERDRSVNVMVKPLVMMEATLYIPRYMNLNPEQCYRKAAELAATCRTLGGVFNMLWHNSELATEDRKSLYSSILDLR